MFKRSHRRSIGHNAEQIARQHLQNHGLTFVDKNFHCRQGEIDLIFKDKESLVFVEVRYRKNTDYGHALETVTIKKQQKIMTTAQYYLHTKHLTESASCRFDIVAIEGCLDKSEDFQLQWIKNAFD